MRKDIKMKMSKSHVGDGEHILLWEQRTAVRGNEK